MAHHNETGKLGEALAATWFREKEYTILHQNWRHKHWEVDIIASHLGMLHFIEVKSRTSYMFGYPEQHVGTKKIKNLMGAAEEYLYLHPEWKRIQFDILSITIGKKSVNYFLIEDIYV